MKDTYLTTPEVAAALGVNVSRVRQLTLAGDLAAAPRKVGNCKLYERREVERLKKLREKSQRGLANGNGIR